MIIFISQQPHHRSHQQLKLQLSSEFIFMHVSMWRADNFLSKPIDWIISVPLNYASIGLKAV